MGYNVIITTTAKKSFQQNVIYIKENWTNKEVKHFILKTESIINLLKKSPKTFQKREHSSSVRKVLVVKQITLFYRIKNKSVEILLFWNNYKNPDYLKNVLS